MFAADQKSQLNILINALVVCPPGAPTRFVDNGDGTVCDHQTGLMWEQKDGPSDSTADLTNPHDVDNAYTSTSTDDDLTDPDGTAFTDFLARLNGSAAGTPSSEQLGGDSDWRLPTSAELQTLLFEPYPCSISPCIIDPEVFGPTAASFYWSSTSFAIGPSYAWGVDFGFGFVGFEYKFLGQRVRAVRGGR